MSLIKLAHLLLLIVRMIMESNKEGRLIQQGKTQADHDRAIKELDRIQQALDAGRASLRNSASGGLQDDDGYKRD